jgi:pyruvate formate lyase activating enzyme
MGILNAIITNIQGYSIHDGPGIRTVVFFKGCPLRCIWCANPENLTGDIQVGFMEKLCTECKRCVDACPCGAIQKGEGVYRIDRSKCTGCGACADACYYGALVRYGEPMTAAEVFDKVRRDKMFYDTSGGGVTASGGEPLLHPGFVKELFTSCHDEGIDTCIETCGDVPKRALEEVLGATDHFLFDLKIMDGDEHKKYTGASNDRILANAAFLVGQKADVLFRQPLIPGVNDGDENIRATADYMKGLGEGGRRLQLMPYHRMGQSKYAALDMKYETEDIGSITMQDAEKVMDKYNALGVTCTVSK